MGPAESGSPLPAHNVESLGGGCETLLDGTAPDERLSQGSSTSLAPLGGMGPEWASDLLPPCSE